MDLPINIIAGTLPTGAVYNPQTYFNAIVARMTASVSGGNVLFGQLGGSEPTGSLPGSGSQAGLWFGNPTPSQMGYWNDWNTAASKYLPIPLVCGQYISSTLRRTEFVCGASTSDRKITTPDNSGTMALISDLVQQLNSQTFSGLTTVAIDMATTRFPVHLIMGADVTVNLLNLQDGLILDIFCENRTGAGTFHITVTGAFWPAAGTGAQALSIGAAGQRVIDHVRVYREAGMLFTEIVATNFRIGTGVDTTVPVPISQTAAVGSSQINITFDHPLAGGTIPAADFAVIKNGNTDAVTSAIYSGNTVSVFLATAIGALTDVVTVQYTGSPDIKSVAGNTVANFGPKTVSITNGGGGVHNPALPP